MLGRWGRECSSDFSLHASRVRMLLHLILCYIWLKGSKKYRIYEIRNKALNINVINLRHVSAVVLLWCKAIQNKNMELLATFVVFWNIVRTSYCLVTAIIAVIEPFQKTAYLGSVVQELLVSCLNIYIYIIGIFMEWKVWCVLLYIIYYEPLMQYYVYFIMYILLL